MTNSFRASHSRKRVVTEQHWHPRTLALPRPAVRPHSGRHHSRTHRMINTPLHAPSVSLDGSSVARAHAGLGPRSSADAGGAGVELARGDVEPKESRLDSADDFGV